MSIEPETFRLDIMMPFYGDVDYFKRAVESVLGQSDPSWRLVIIDDLYPDQSAGQWAKALGDDRIIYLRNEINLGVTGNFSRCVELAESEFMVIMGCDDILLAGYVARLRALITDFPDAAYIQPAVCVIDVDGEVCVPLADRVKKLYRPRLTRPTVMSGELLARGLLRGNWTYFPSIAWRREIVKASGFRADLRIVLDLALQLQIIGDGGAVAIDTSEPVYSYRRHSGSVSAWTAGDGTRFEEESSYFRESAAYMRRRGWNGAARAARLRLSSRLNELASVPRALTGAGPRAALKLAKHAVVSR